MGGGLQPLLFHPKTTDIWPDIVNTQQRVVWEIVFWGLKWESFMVYATVSCGSSWSSEVLGPLSIVANVRSFMILMIHRVWLLCKCGILEPLWIVRWVTANMWKWKWRRLHCFNIWRPGLEYMHYAVCFWVLNIYHNISVLGIGIREKFNRPLMFVK